MDADNPIQSKTGVKGKQRKNNLIGLTTPKTKMDGIVRKKTTVFKANKYATKKLINKTNFNFDGDHTEGESFSSEEVANSFDVRIEKIIPEILRLQFFQTRQLDDTDCLLKVCEKYLKEDSSCLDCPDHERFATFFRGIQNFTLHSGSTAKRTRYDNATLAEEETVDNHPHNDNEKNMLIDEYHEKIIRLLNSKYNNSNTRYFFKYFYLLELADNFDAAIIRHLIYR